MIVLLFFLSILHDTCLLQCHTTQEISEEVQFEVAPHGNRKHGKKPFYRT